MKIILNVCTLIEQCLSGFNRVNMAFDVIYNIMVLQERLGETPGNEDLRSGRNDQHLNDDTQQTGQTEAMQGVH